MQIREPLNPTTRRILLVEDHEDSRRAITRLLEINGHMVLNAEDGRSALRLAQTQSFELALIDISLPDMDGVELLAELQRHRPVDAIAVTGHALETDHQRFAAAGFRALLLKPITIARLLKLIEPQAAPD